MISSQRIIQGLSLTVFVAALCQAPRALLSLWPADGFIRLDPLVFLGTALADRQFAPLLWVAAAVLLLALVLGRFFCAYLCPLGTTLDITDRLLCAQRKARLKKRAGPPLRSYQNHVLLYILGAAVLGISLVFFASPLSLITRFYGLIIYPLGAFLADMGLTALRPAADRLDLTTLAYAVVKAPRYDLQWLTLLLLLGIFAGGLWSPRFWCRYLCPSGALLALFAIKPLVRRRVSGDCTKCGLCVEKCPMGAIGGPGADGSEHPDLTRHKECIACLSCVRICPVQAVSFDLKPPWEIPGPDAILPDTGESAAGERRRLLAAGLSGAATAMVSLTGLKSPHAEPGPGSIVHPSVIRPPGAVPENDFLARCIRCGACLTACPTNTLQPLGLAAGLTAFFSPVVTPRRGPCDPGCHACGAVCPTGAIPWLPPAERRSAKVGTARLDRRKCLAWEFDKKCLICDEVCPYDAVEFRVVPGQPVPVPFIREYKCAGCGYCEHHCPVRAVPAIVVTPMLALRLAEGSHREMAREMGYSLEVGKKMDGPPNYPGQDASTPPELDENGLPPGFTE